MQLKVATAKWHRNQGGQDWYFCGQGCLKKFEADPAKYDGSAPPQPIDASLQTLSAGGYICPMDPEVFSTRPAACPKYGMALEPKQVAAPGRAHGVHLPHASADCARLPRCLSSLQDGP